MVGRTRLFQETRSPLIRGFTRPARSAWKTAAVWIVVLVVVALCVLAVTSWLYQWPMAL
jgi:hypothetical protein